MDAAPETAQIPHGIMGLQPRPVPWGSILLGAVLLVLLLVLAYFLWQRWQQRRSRRVPVPSPLPMNPWDRLLLHMQALAAAPNWQRTDSEEFFFQLSFALREGLELATGLPITGQTLAETRLSLGKSPRLSANFQEELIKFLGLAEQLKFAGRALDPTEAMEWREKVQGWLEQLRAETLS